MSRDVDKAAMKELLSGLTDAEVRALCVDALREWHRKHPGHTQPSMHGDLGRELVPTLLRGRTLTISGAAPHEALIDAVTEPGMEGFAEFVGWFTRAGFAWPLAAQGHQYPIAMHLTKSGLRFLEGTTDHPLLPGSIDRIVSRCAGLPDDVAALLVDARSCLDHALLRPAIQLMGVAYELAIEHVVEALISRGALPATALNERAARRIALVDGKVDTVITGTTTQATEERFAVHHAYDFADRLRQRRNDASHTAPKYDFSDREETEEYFVSAGRHLPNVWRMYRP